MSLRSQFGHVCPKEVDCLGSLGRVDNILKTFGSDWISVLAVTNHVIGR